MSASTFDAFDTHTRSAHRYGSARLIFSILLLNGYAIAQETSALSFDNLPTSSSLSSSPPLEPRQLRPRTRSPISISSSLPSTDSLPSQLSSTFESVLSSLTSTAESLSARTIRASHLSIQGLPGTAIEETEDFESLQAYLDCTAGNGEWIYDPLGTSLAEEGKGLMVHKMDGKYASCDKRFYKSTSSEEEEEGEWKVRESLKYRFKPSSTCSSLLPTHLRPETPHAVIPSRTRFCQLLAHKSLLLLGSTQQYSLHDLLLDFTTTEPQSCYGDLYCKEHALCGTILGNKDIESVENWEIDQRVYHRLPLPPPQSRSSSQLNLPPASSLKSPFYPSASYSILLRYRRTDGLRPSTAQTLPSYQHPFTSLPERNQQWLADSRRSDIVILEKQPIPLPLRSHNSTFDTWFYEYLEDDHIEVDDKVERLLEAVREVTEKVWIPELMDAIKAIRAEPSPQDQLIVYRSGWRIQHDCAAASKEAGEDWDSPGDGNLPPLSQQPNLDRLIWRSSSSKQLQPLHVIYHNLQLVFQNHISRQSILPSFGIIYLDLETPLSIWRTGLLGSSSAGKEIKGMRSRVGGDCSRYCFPSPGEALEGAFVGGLNRLMEVAWAGSESAEKEWVGGEFKNLRLRLKEREEAV